MAESVPNVVALQLPASTVVATSRASLGAHAMDAMHYIYNIEALHTPVAETFKRPVVVNLSYGAIAGAHDDTSILEAAMDDLLTLRAHNTAIVLAAGNARETQTHISGNIEPDKVFAFNWTLPPSDAATITAQAWVDNTRCRTRRSNKRCKRRWQKTIRRSRKRPVHAWAAGDWMFREV